MHRQLLPLGLATAFLIGIAAWAGLAWPDSSSQWIIVLAAAAAGYMALNIGANDVANNMGPSVGAKALTMTAALLIAAIFDVAGALIAGGDVVDTVANDLLLPDAGLTGNRLVLVMVAALIAAALWINGSTFVGAPVSTTHAIVGAIVGAAVMSAGPAAISWPTLFAIGTSWVLSPLLGGFFAATLHALIRRLITRRRDKLAAARRWVPVFTGVMAGTFAIYLVTKTGAHIASLSLPGTLILGLAGAALGWAIAAPWTRRRSQKLENRKKQVARLFRPPLVVAAALLSFAHGANDLANTLGPLSAILEALRDDAATAAPTLPLWALLAGAIGIGAGIALFGSRVIHTVGEQITKLNEIRAFCVALSAAVTVLAAAGLGLPVSSTHVAVGAVFGVGFLREFLAIRNMSGAGVPVATYTIEASMLNDTPEQAVARERRYERRYLVRRLNLLRIGAAWLVTLPAAAALSAGTYFVLQLAIG